MAEQHLSATLKRILWPLRLTLLGLWAERVSQAFWPLWSLLFLVITLLAFGLQDHLPSGALWASGGVLLLALLAAVAFGLKRFRLPKRAEALSRLDAHLPGRPLQALGDVQASGEDDPASVALWQRHLARMAEQAAKAQAVPPDAQLARRDPYALRYVALLGLVMALMFGSLWRLGSLGSVMPMQGGAIAPSISWEAWAEPPRHTGKPRLYLNDIKPGPLEVPIGSKLIFRLYGAPDQIGLRETVSGESGAGTPKTAASKADLPKAESSLHEMIVTRSGEVSIEGADQAAWQISALPDAPPRIAAEGEIGREADGRFKQSFQAQDDYGVTAGQVTISLDLAAIERRHGLTTDPEPQPPVVLDLPLPLRGNRTGFTEILIDDLSKHLFANLPVQMVFEAQDALGQSGRSEPVAVVLPGKRFFDPLAAALIELRRDLLWSRANASRVAQILKAVTALPEGFIRNERAYLRLRVLMRALDASKTTLSDTARAEITEELWQGAVLVEEGDLASATERLRRAQDRLDEAIRNGASPEEVASLMEELRKALDDYMNQLAQEAERNPDSQLSQNQDSMEMTGDQLQDMLDELQRLMEEGRMAEAQELMQMLRQLMENMQVTQGGGGQGQGRGNQAMRDLGQTLRDQQGLSDDSFRNLQSDPFNEGQGEGQGQGEGADGPNLAERQRSLRQGLNRLGTRDMPGDGSERGEAGRQQLDRADRAMREAEEALRRGDLSGALDNQAEAMEALREGMRNFGEALAQQQGLGQSGSQQGQAQNGQGQGVARDPLGRPLGGTGEIGTDGNMLQGLDPHRRAQDLLDEIRRRSGEHSRPEAERDYLRRLLDQF